MSYMKFEGLGDCGANLNAGSEMTDPRPEIRDPPYSQDVIDEAVRIVEEREKAAKLKPETWRTREPML